MSVPEKYQRYVEAGQLQIQQSKVELHDDRDPIVWVEDAYGQSVPMRRSQVPAVVHPEPRDLAPQPLFDPTAQRLLAGGVGSGVALWGGGHFLAGAGQFVSGLSGVGALLFFLALAGARAAFAGGRQGGTRIEVHNHNRGFGRSTTNL